MQKTVRRVFISHIHEEKGLALALQELIYEQLRDSLAGTVQCFLSSDRFQLDAGEDWIARVKEELSKTDVVVLMLSPESLKRHWVNLEGGAAWVTDRLVIPVHYSGLTVANIPRPYVDFNAIDLETEPYHLLRTIGKSLVLTPPPLPHDHPAHKKLQDAIARNTQRLAAWKTDTRKGHIQEIFYFAIAEIADRSGIPVRDIGMHAWNVQTIDSQEVLKRFVRGRLSHSPTSPLRVWPRGDGAVGVCWATEQDIVLDLTDLRYSANSEAEWQKLPAELRFGMSLHDFRQTTTPFKAIFAVPIKPEESFIGCVSANIDRDVGVSPAEIWRSAKEVMRRVATDVGRILQGDGHPA
jgi:hypothetical protein